MLDDARLRRVVHWQDTVAMPTYATREAWLERAAEIREQVLFAAGLLPLPERTPLFPIVTGRQERDGYAIENVAFESFSGFYCTGNLYRPLAPGPHPVVLTPHGHWQKGRFAQRDTGSVPARCINFARQGYLTFSPDMVGYVDSQQVPHRTFDSPRSHLWGIGALGLQLWNNIRSLDYLLALPDADSARVACTGESGGATQAYLLAAVDERVRIVALVNMLSAHYAGGCVCENAPGLRLGLTNMEIVAATAPRPMLIVAATGDWTVNTPRVEYPAVRGIYEILGAADQLECVQFDAPHNSNLDSRQAVYGFLAHHFDGHGAPAPPSAKQVFRAGIARPLAETPGSHIDDTESLRVFAVTTRPAEWKPLDMSTLKKRQQTGVSAGLPSGPARLEPFRALYGSLFRRALGAMLPSESELSIRRGPVHSVTEQTGSSGTVVERLEIGVASQGARIPALLLRPLSAPDDAPPVVLVHEDGRAALVSENAIPLAGDPPRVVAAQGASAPWGSPMLAELLGAGRAVLIPDVFLTGEYLSPVGRAGRPTSDAHFTTYNRTDACLRVQDVLTATVALRVVTGAKDVDVAALGDAGLWALLARAVAPQAVRRLIADAGQFRWHDEAEYLERLYVPHLLRLGGIASAIHLAAPAPLYLFNAGDDRHEAERRLYAELGGAGSLVIEPGPLPGT
ncbi:MAG: hypothetical protein AVDCRST_MAG77-5602 [uncultured Chloroflexi bacterium]|uniref:Acetyl xylan esterase domain-containing protein n=1 Tax=uncultured Chloroflexota bacterium TaxID=166587 RepID=A0A6J4K6K2_9CHLR|nr:MAG: hypothetical protein AVDCRST_MAG77-5602 [uncultured Chloroflexota bacterium]